MKNIIDKMYNQKDVMHAVESGPNGAVYHFDLVRTEVKTFITGADWIRFIEDFEMEVGDRMLFESSSNEDMAMKISPMDHKLNHKYRSNYEYPVDMSDGDY